MANCIVCEKKLGALNKPMFGMVKTKDGDRICTSCNQKLAKKNPAYSNNIKKYSTTEFLEGINFHRIKEIKGMVQGLNPKLVNMPEVEELATLLSKEETINKIESGFLEGGKGITNHGIIVITQSRVLLVDVSSLSLSNKMMMREFPLNQITSIGIERGILKSKLSLMCSGKTSTINILSGAEKFSEYLRQKISEFNQPTQVTNSPNNSDPYEQLEKLSLLKNKGIITNDEFEEKKKKLLHQYLFINTYSK